MRPIFILQHCYMNHLFLDPSLAIMMHPMCLIWIMISKYLSIHLEPIFFYKEFEVNVLNATYDVLWHKTQPIPCNKSIYGNDTFHNKVTNRIWCSDTTYNHNGNWTMYDYKSNHGLKTATSIQHKSNHSQKSTCTTPCKGCPDATPNAWCPWSYLTEHCQQWPQILTESWTVEIRMPLQRSDHYDYGGLLDTDNVELNPQFIRNYNPNSFHNLSEHHVYWWIDFGRTEHPMSYSQSNTWSITKNQTVLNQVLSVYPTLLGVYRYNNYWEWTWQSVGITKYMHYPQFWGILKFIDGEYDTRCLNIEWPARYLLYSLWWANYEYFLYFGGNKYSVNVEELLNDRFCKFGFCDLDALTKAVHSDESCFAFDIEIDSEEGCVNFVDRNLTLEQKLYSGMCYHASVSVRVDTNPHNDYMVNITESHFVSVSKNNYALCL
eukprot:279448_1